MSRNEKRIRDAAAARGIEIKSVTWEPLTKAMLFGGPEGGWLVYLDTARKTYRNDVMHQYSPLCGYNVGEILAQIERITAEDRT